MFNMLADQASLSQPPPILDRLFFNSCRVLVLHSRMHTPRRRHFLLNMLRLPLGFYALVCVMAASPCPVLDQPGPLAPEITFWEVEETFDPRVPLGELQAAALAHVATDQDRENEVIELVLAPRLLLTPSVSVRSTRFRPEPLVAAGSSFANASSLNASDVLGLDDAAVEENRTCPTTPRKQRLR